MNETELITKHAEIKSKLDKLEKEKTEVREQIAQLLHDEGVNEKTIMDDYGTEWNPKYQNTTRKSTDYDLLLHYVGSEKYDEIVKGKTTTSLVIKKAPKKKKKEKTVTSEAPNEIKEDITKTIPKGKIE